MGLVVDFLAASFSSLSTGGKFGRSLLCGLVTSIPGIIIFIGFHRGIKKGDVSDGARRVKKAAWACLAGWFSVGFFTVWICYWINPRT
jgi:hypothetical protein